MKELIERLAKIQLELNAPKDKTSQGIKYKYRTKEGILEAVKPLLNGLIIRLYDEVIYIEGRFYIKTTASISDGENEVAAIGWAREPDKYQAMNESQTTGSASSYAGKYALNNLLAIDDNQDADQEDVIITTEQACYLERLLDNSTYQNTDQYNVLLDKIATLPISEYEKAKNNLITNQLHESETLPGTSTGSHL